MLTKSGILEEINKNIKAEKVAIALYQQTAKHVDPVTARTFLSIVNDEKEHIVRLMRAAKRINE